MFEDTPVEAGSSTPTPMDPRRLTPAARVELAVWYARELATLEARNLELHAAIADKDNTSIRLADRIIENPASDELATELHISSRAAISNPQRADTVSRFLPRTLISHRAGDLSSVKVRILAEELPPAWQTDAEAPHNSIPTGRAGARLPAAVAAPAMSRTGPLAPTSTPSDASGLKPSTRQRSPKEARQLLEELVLPRAPRQTPHEFRRSVRRAIARIDARLSNETARTARRERGVNLFELPHGVALLEATLTVEEGRRAYDLLTRNARVEADFLRTTLAGSPVAAGSTQSQVSESDHSSTSDMPLLDITLDSIRADMLMEALTNSRSQDPNTTVGQGARLNHTGGRNRIAAVVDLPTLLGLADNPAEIPGYGPIPAHVARQIARDAQWERWVSDPSTGHVLDVGRSRYTPPVGLRDYLAARDGVCRFPGCNRDASVADQDHVIAWEDGGTTSAENLGSLCRRHHRLKTVGTW
ncbi:MAG: DUF222 domain-containing protein, partial [Candidatus Nanopelagicales bacterium]